MRLLTAIAFALGCSPALFATDRYYPDVDVKSDSGRYRITAKSPDNQAARPRAFQRGFVYTCTDTQSGQVLWTRKPAPAQPRAGVWPDFESAPMQIFVANDGWGVIHNSWEQLFCIDPAGKVRAAINLLRDTLSKEERDEYVVFSTAGPRWTMMSLWYFLKDDDRRLFVIRLWWGRHIVIDMEEGKVVADTKKLTPLMKDHESRRILTVLKQACQGDIQSPSFETQTAAYLAGRLELHDAIDSLRQLEESTYSGANSSSFGLGSYYEYTLRQLAQLSLRRLGEKPRALPAYKFSTAVELPPTEDRDNNTARLTIGMTQKQVVQLLGVPDLIKFGWTYDFDTTKPYSVTLGWDHETGKLNHMSRQKPASWKTGFKRDRKLVY